MADPFNLDLTAAQINTALNNSWDVDNQPISDSGKLVNSKNIHEFVTGLVGDEATARENADDALSGRVDTLEGSSPVWARFTKASQSMSIYSTDVFQGYTEEDPSSIASESSGVITVTGSGVYQVMFSLNFQVTNENASSDFALQFRVNSARVGGYNLSNAAFVNYAASPSYTGLVVSSDSFTVDMRVTINNVGYTVASDLSISVLKLS